MSSNARSILRNSFASTGSQLINLMVGLVSSVYVARELGVSQFGMLNWAFGLAMIASPLASTGVDNVIVREVARKRNNLPEHLASALAIKAVISVICYLGIIIYIQARGYSPMQLAVGYIICATVISDALIFGSQAALVALERQEITACIAVIVNAVRVAAVVLLVHVGFGVIAVSWITVCASAASLIAQLLVLRRLTTSSWRPRTNVIKHQLVGGASYVSSTIFNGVFNRADYVMLDLYRGVEAVGIYGAAYRIIEIVTTIAYNTSLALFPVLSRKAQDSAEGYSYALTQSTKYLASFGIPFCVGIFLLSNQIIVGLYSDRYAAAGTCLAILIWSRIGAFAVLPGQQGVQARNAQIWLVPAAVVRACTNIGLNFYLIPRYGFIGASVAMLFTEPLYYLLMYLVAFRGPERFNPIKLLAKPIFASAVMAGIVLLLRQFSVIASIAAAVPTYVLTLLAIRGIDANDRQIIARLIARPTTVR